MRESDIEDLADADLATTGLGGRLREHVHIDGGEVKKHPVPRIDIERVINNAA